MVTVITLGHFFLLVKYIMIAIDSLIHKIKPMKQPIMVLNTPINHAFLRPQKQTPFLILSKNNQMMKNRLLHIDVQQYNQAQIIRRNMIYNHNRKIVAINQKRKQKQIHRFNEENNKNVYVESEEPIVESEEPIVESEEPIVESEEPIVESEELIVDEDKEEEHIACAHVSMEKFLFYKDTNCKYYL